ncbi:carotenoid biosynthesis protein, partial [Mucilaginibacter sp.]|uniref:carotenoid biosynthesis protein n=1 Tax=Mucilaginibacter sp. TaxID=1882438 RepID=UPI00261A84DC
LIILFHLVGLMGLSINISRPFFLQLVPYHLLLMLLILVFTHDRLNTKFALFFAVIFIIGFAVEWVGVHTGMIFGNYVYGDVLGLKLDAVPLIIGVNWFILIYSVGVLLQQSRIKPVWVRMPVGALILVLLDAAIEPVAVKFNYWHWAGNTIPITNYVCWFIIGLALLTIFEISRFKKQSMVGAVLLVSQFIFFLALLSY